ncbi:conserved hypothetical protein [Ricinus communis]|uniref:Uncharacterized protein n=1 Tax=Ricinus communis TaxID=3988 RepID=B9SDF6_RICCO|nr:conserved hypothetical protein [Ricinus communis]
MDEVGANEAQELEASSSSSSVRWRPKQLAFESYMPGNGADRNKKEALRVLVRKPELRDSVCTELVSNIVAAVALDIHISVHFPKTSVLKRQMCD